MRARAASSTDPGEGRQAAPQAEEAADLEQDLGAGGAGEAALDAA